MPKEYSRVNRVAEQIKRELSTLIREELQDPRLKMPSVTEVQVTRDFGHAKVYISSLDFDGGCEKSVEALQDAAIMLRRRLGKRLRLRSIPQLHFLADNLQVDAMRMDALIDKAVGKKPVVKADDSDQDFATDPENN